MLQKETNCSSCVIIVFPLFASAEMCRVGLGQGSPAIDHVQSALGRRKNDMVDASTNDATSSPEQKPSRCGRKQDQRLPGGTRGQTEFCQPRLAAAATIDELLAKEALASLRRTRTTAHAEAVKSKPRIPVPPATLVVKPPQSHAWMTPFITLAMMVGISTFLCTGGMAYLFLRPVAVASNSDAELRNIRELVAQLRRTVAALSNDLAANRTALDAANKAVSDRFGRFVQNLERVERDQSVSATKIERIAEEKAQVVRRGIDCSILRNYRNRSSGSRGRQMRDARSSPAGACGAPLRASPFSRDNPA